MLMSIINEDKYIKLRSKKWSPYKDVFFNPLTFKQVYYLGVPTTLSSKYLRKYNIKYYDVNLIDIYNYSFDKKEYKNFNYIEGIFYEFTTNKLYLSTSNPNSSDESGLVSVFFLSPTDKKIKPIKTLKINFWAEDITIPHFNHHSEYDNKLLILSYLVQKAHIINPETLKLDDKSFTLKGQGWGLTNDENYLYYTDGTNIIKRCNLDSFKDYNDNEVYILKVNKQYSFPHNMLNAICYHDNHIYISIYQTIFICAFNLKTKQIIYYNAYHLWKKLSLEDPTNYYFLNGITYTGSTGDSHTFIIGFKNSNSLYKISLLKPEYCKHKYIN